MRQFLVPCLTIALALPASAQTPAQKPAPFSANLRGNWAIVEGDAAPWAPVPQQATLAAIAKRMAGTTVTFSATEIVSKERSIACKRAVYESTAYDPDALFLGNMPDGNPGQTAQRLGLPRGEVQSVDVRCRSGQFVYHFRDANTALTTVNNLILTLERR